MRVVQVDHVNAHIPAVSFPRDWDKGGVTAEAIAAVGVIDATELGSEEDVLAFLRVGDQPLSNAGLRVALGVDELLPMCIVRVACVDIARVSKRAANLVGFFEECQTWRIFMVKGPAVDGLAETYRTVTSARDQMAVHAKVSFGNTRRSHRRSRSQSGLVLWDVMSYVYRLEQTNWTDGLEVRTREDCQCIQKKALPVSGAAE